MEDSNQRKWKPHHTLKLLARILVALFIILTFIKSLPIIFPENTGNDVVIINHFQTVMIYFMGIYLLGLLLGFIWIGLGGIISLISLISVFLYSLFIGKIGEGIWLLSFALLVAAIPCVLYLLSWYYARKVEKAEK
jgi:uncharacterized protein YqhQ